MCSSQLENSMKRGGSSGEHRRRAVTSGDRLTSFRLFRLHESYVLLPPIVPSSRLLSVQCPACRVRLTMIIDDKSEPLMMQAWKCPVCAGSHEAVFIQKIKQITRPMEYPREP